MGCNLVKQGILPLQCSPLRGSFSYHEVFFCINPIMNAHRFHLLYNRCAIHNILPHAIFTMCLDPSTMQQMIFFIFLSFKFNYFHNFWFKIFDIYGATCGFCLHSSIINAVSLPFVASSSFNFLPNRFSLHHSATASCIAF